ncbi:protocadherin alpha-4-like [Haliotis rubra]|uniref:protocadherin alpha-4-like n=1 Tax=Haliotis rubra TaxID=36100 RepID=UPI001EE5EFEC|nr:protocadherin alpha-4-like [Haliotis rubra]XP_046555892.1 protocadherin alpha-4-like [Haliotis rubra]
MGLKMYVVILTTVLISTCVSQDLTFRIDEEQQAGTFVGRISDATDLQSALSDDAMRTLRYSFLTQGYPYSALFTIHNTTGEIYTALKLDREDICGFSFQCVLDLEVAVQSSTSQYFRKIWTSVYLQDINDNKPVFPKPSIDLEISEAVSINSSLAIDGAVDKDIGNNSLQSYELTPYDSPFTLHVVSRLDGGTIVSLVVRHALDRETASSHQITIFAKDGGNPASTGSVSVTVDVIDVNDNAPVFSPASYNVTVRETTLEHTAIFRVTATDTDIPENGVAYYRFSPLQSGNVKRYFDVNDTTGEVTVVSSLEGAQGERFMFYVECVDGGSPPLISQATVEIYVEDTINSPPSINLNLLYGGLVSEYAQPGTVVAHIAVLDLDSGRNGIIRCNIVSVMFELQGLDVNEYKVIVVRPLNSEVTKEHYVTVTCQDAGNPPLNTTIDFTVLVKDENDNSPVFSKDVYTASVVENVKGVVITRVRASDKDSGSNGEIDFIIPYADKMGLDVLKTGEVISAVEFDREFMPKMAVPIVARDRGNPPRNATATLMITVDDVNDVEPSFQSSLYKFKVMENRAPGTEIDKVHALDLDTGVNGEVVYSIDDNSDDPPIEILPGGQLRTTRRLDREMVKEFRVKVWAKDKGVPVLSSSTTVVVEVGDENDNPPKIQSPDPVNSSIAIPYHTSPGSPILSVVANDADEGINARFQFYVARGQRRVPPTWEDRETNTGVETDTFGINSHTGELLLKRKLSEEDVGKYRMVIIVTDQGIPQLSSNATLEVYIFASNETYYDGPGMSEENAIVVVILGSLTGIVTVVVIVTILIIKRADRARKTPRGDSVPQLPTPAENEQVKVKTHDAIVIRNDISFDSQASSHMSIDSHGKLILGPGDGTQNTQPGDDGMYPGNTTADEWSTALKIHKDLLRMHGVDSNTPRRSSDDANSDTSGETTTSDSGRGGSDEDSHGRASPVTQKVSTTLSSRQMYRQKKASDYVKGLGKMSTNSFGGTIGNSFEKIPNASQSNIRSSSQRPAKHVTFQSDLPVDRNFMESDDFNDGPFYVNGHTENSRGMFSDDVNLSFDANDDDTTTSGSYTVDDHLSNDITIPRMNDVLV